VDLAESSTLVTGGASGLGRATAEALVSRGAFVTIVDLPTSSASFSCSVDLTSAAADVRSTEQLNEALDVAERSGPLRAVVHCAGRGARVRVIEKDGEPGSLETYEEIIKLNLIGSFNVLRLAAVRMARAEPIESERGVCVLTASVAAWEGQIGQIPYASSKAGIVGMTLVAARDLASKLIRVVTIAPGVMDTPILDRVRSDVKEALEASVPHPRRLGRPEEFADLALAIIGNPYLNGETIRLDGGIRMAPR
jgi:NAD(P)-dependent dehydrogenase (short-subunit alcohol dehydrogenase family)